MAARASPPSPVHTGAQERRFVRPLEHAAEARAAQLLPLYRALRDTLLGAAEAGVGWAARAAARALCEQLLLGVVKDAALWPELVGGEELLRTLRSEVQRRRARAQLPPAPVPVPPFSHVACAPMLFTRRSCAARDWTGT